MSDLDRIAAAVRHVARDSELMLDPRRWGVEQIREFLRHIESKAPAYEELNAFDKDGHLTRFRVALSDLPAGMS